MYKIKVPPREGFIIITDCEGNIVETYGMNSIIDEILYMVEYYDRNHSSDAPHSAWKFTRNEFTIVK